MTVRELMRALVELRPDEVIRVDAAGRGTFDIAEVEKMMYGHGLLVTSSEYYERESIHDKDETIAHFTSERG